MGKGSNRRPSQVDRKEFDDNWNNIFKKKKAKKSQKRGKEEKPPQHEGEKEVTTWSTEQRADGRLELVCGHGVGHPSYNLTKRRVDWQKHMGIHGCDGCCGLPSFKQYEEELLNEANTIV